MANAPFCPACGARLRWVAEQQAWGCDRCRQLVPAAAKFAPVAPQAPPGAPPAAAARSRTGLYLGIALLVLAAGGAVVAAVVLRGGEDGDGRAFEPQAEPPCVYAVRKLLATPPLRDRYDDDARTRLHVAAVEHCAADRWSSATLACLTAVRETTPEAVGACLDELPAAARERFMAAMDAAAKGAPAVKVAGLAPATGPAAGGTEVVITGAGFTPAGEVAVSFGSTRARVVRVEADKLVVVAPPGDAGKVSVTVAFAAGAPHVLDGAFTYEAAPDVFAGIGGAIGSIGGSVVGTGRGTAQDGDGPCERYKALIARAVRCEALPAEARQSLRDSVAMMEEAWGHLANLPAESRQSAEDACRQGHDAMAQALASMCPDLAGR